MQNQGIPEKWSPSWHRPYTLNRSGCLRLGIPKEDLPLFQSAAMHRSLFLIVLKQRDNYSGANLQLRAAYHDEYPRDFGPRIAYTES